jgi:hypothetical protein
MKRSDIDDNFYQKDKRSSKGQKKTHLKEGDSLERKRKLQFKNFVRNLQDADRAEEDEEDDYN